MMRVQFLRKKHPRVQRNRQVSSRRMVFETLEWRHLLSATLTPLGALPGYTTCQPLYINDSGQVAGYCDGSNSEESFLYSGGKMIDLGPTAPVGLDAAGDIVLNANSYSSYVQSDGTTTAIKPVVGPDGATRQMYQAYAVSPNGQVVGWGYSHGNGINENDNYIYSNGVYTTLGNYGNTPQPLAINDSGQVVGLGNYAPYLFLYSGGSWTPLPAIPGASTYAVVGINSSGQVAGDYEDARGGTHVFV